MHNWSFIYQRKNDAAKGQAKGKEVSYMIRDSARRGKEASVWTNFSGVKFPNRRRDMMIKLQVNLQFAQLYKG